MNQGLINQLNARQKQERPPADFSDCDEMYLYNATQTAPFSKYYLLLDVRERALFDKSCIYYAVHLDIHQADDLSKVSKLQELACSKKNALKYIDTKRVIIYTNNAAEKEQWSEKLNALTELLKQTQKVTNCRVLSSGFDEFCARYPFLIVEDAKTKLPRYPHEIIEAQLFLGDGQQATRQQIVQDLKITHIANISKEIPCAFKDRGINYIDVQIQDKEDEDISVHFDKVIQFIVGALQTNGKEPEIASDSNESKNNEEEEEEEKEENVVIDAKQANKNGNRVLVHCEYGISRSSSMVIAYLMTMNKWDFETAKKHVQSKRRQISPNDGFVAKLKEYEKTIL